MHAADTFLIGDPFDALHLAAGRADRTLVAALMAALKNSETQLAQFLPEWAPHDAFYLAVSTACGRFLYRTARACKARRIVEFGTSMGVSTSYLAAALRDNGGGHLIGSEWLPAKVQHACANLAAAGFADLVEIRAGDARATLRDVGGPVDLVLLDGEYAHYLPVLRLLEPQLRPGAVIVADNALDPDYLDYVRNPANGYRSTLAPLGDGRNIELTTWTVE